MKKMRICDKKIKHFKMNTDPIATDDAIEKALWAAEDAMNRAHEELKEYVHKTNKLKEIYLAFKKQVEYLKYAASISFSVETKKRKFDDLFEEEVATQTN